MQVDAQRVIERLGEKLVAALKTNAILEVQVEILDQELTDTRTIMAENIRELDALKKMMEEKEADPVPPKSRKTSKTEEE